jgi:hypothetical protein
MQRDEDERERVCRQGTEAWKRLKREKSWHDWLKVGEAMLIGRDWAMRTAGTNRPEGKGYNMAFGEWLHKYKMQDMDKASRSRLFDIMENLGPVEEWRNTHLTLTERLKFNHPNAVWRKYKSAHEPPNEQRGRPTLRDSVVTLSEDNAVKDRRIAELEARLQELEASTESRTPAERPRHTTCDFDEEHDREPGESEQEARANAFHWQWNEAVRLAEESALTRDGTAPNEITDECLNAVKQVIEAWTALSSRLTRTHKPADRG